MRWWVAGLIIFALFAPLRTAPQAEATVSIASPAAGATLRGPVEVTGSSAVDGFLSAEISFAYASDLSTWFLIATSDQPVTDGLLATWDTNAITDGDYVLRLHVTLQDSSVLETFVGGLQIRNQSLAPTATSESGFPPAVFDTPVPTQIELPAVPLPPSPTPFAPNPATVTQTEIVANLQHGLIIALLSFLFIGILIRLRRS